MAIADDWSIDYSTKTITHSSGSTVYTVLELYSWIMDVFDDASQMDDTIPMDAQTPTAFSAEEHEALMAVPAATVNAAAVWNYTR